METIEQRTERARLLAEYAARGGRVTVCGATRHRTTTRPLTVRECTAPGVVIVHDRNACIIDLYAGTAGRRRVATHLDRWQSHLFHALAAAARMLQDANGWKRGAWRNDARAAFVPDYDGIDAFTTHGDTRAPMFTSLFDRRADDEVPSC